MFRAAALLSPATLRSEPAAKFRAAARRECSGAPTSIRRCWKELNYPALWDAFLAKKIAVPMYIDSGR
jgi:hypothetical protein